MSLKTILLVDDEESDREQIRDILHSQDYMILEAGAYHDAIRVFERNRDVIDLLISDISFPVKMVAISPSHSESRKPTSDSSSFPAMWERSRFYGLELSNQYFLRKPFALADLLERVSQILKSTAAFPKLCAPGGWGDHVEIEAGPGHADRDMGPTGG